MQQFTRGEQLEFTVAFTAEDNSGTQPTTAQLAITYTSGGSRQRQVYSLVKGDDGKWRYTWNSTASAAGYVNYSIKALGDLRDVEDGSFVLTANDANV